MGRPPKSDDLLRIAIEKMWEGYIELKQLGWQDIIYCPKDGTHFQTIQMGSTGIHDCAYHGKWPDGYWMTYDDHDCYPASSITALFRLYPADAKAARIRAEAERQKEGVTSSSSA